MNIAIDGRILEWHYSGIARYVNLLLSFDFWRAHNTTIYLPQKTNLQLAPPFKKRVLINPFRRRELYEQIILPIQLSRDKINLFIQPYNFGIPILYGGKSILIVFDIIPLLFKDYFYYARVKRWARFNYLLNAKIAVARATKIICDSSSAREDLINYFPSVDREKIDYIYYGFEKFQKAEYSNFYKFKKEKNIKKEYLLVNAGLEPRKNIHLLISAYAKVLKGQKNIPQLVITGFNKYYFDVLKQTAKKEKITDRVIFTDSITENEKNALVKNAALIINPSLFEGFGIPIIEAASFQKPIIASNIPAFKEVGGSYPIYFQSNSKSDLIDKLTSFFKMRKMEEERARQKSAEVISRFPVSKMHERWKKLMETIL